MIKSFETDSLVLVQDGVNAGGIHPLQVKLELLHSVLHLIHTHHTGVTVCDWVMFGDIISFQVVDKHKSSSKHQKDIYSLYTV